MKDFYKHQLLHLLDGMKRAGGLVTLRKMAFAALFLIVCHGPLSSDCQGQLSQDIRDVFEGMMDNLDEELQQKFKQAIEDDTDEVVFTPEQFLRFRDHPANPFEGMDGIEAEPGGVNISLRFTLPSIRDRAIDPLERQNPWFLSRVSAPALAAANSTVRIYSRDRHIAMGVVVDSDGLIVTKASELEGRKSVACLLPNGRQVAARQWKINQEHDLALLKVEANSLVPVTWGASEPTLGAFLLSPDRDGSLLAMGSYSVKPRSTAKGEQAFLGVQPVTAPQGVLVRGIEPGAASHNAGLRDGDVITHLAKTRTTDVASFVRTIRQFKPGDEIEIRFIRNGNATQTAAVLEGNRLSSDRAARFKMMNRLGAVPSRRDGNFPLVFQHDTPLFPEQCGGPIVDLDGQVVGLNIARRGRAASFALPANLAREVIDGMLKETVAQATTD